MRPGYRMRMAEIEIRHLGPQTTLTWNHESSLTSFLHNTYLYFCLPHINTFETMSDPHPPPPAAAAGDAPPTYVPSQPQILVAPLPDSPSFFWGRTVQGEVFVKGLGDKKGNRGVKRL
jgi:hypothetical protein